MLCTLSRECVREREKKVKEKKLIKRDRGKVWKIHELLLLLMFGKAAKWREKETINLKVDWIETKVVLKYYWQMFDRQLLKRTVKNNLTKCCLTAGHFPFLLPPVHDSPGPKPSPTKCFLCNYVISVSFCVNNQTQSKQKNTLSSDKKSLTNFVLEACPCWVEVLHGHSGIGQIQVLSHK